MEGGTGISFDNPATIYEVVCQWAALTPDAPVFVESGRSPLTYAGLKAVLEDFRQSLSGHGFGRNDRIAVVHPGGAATVSSILGVSLCAGAVPLNPAYTLGEFAIYFRDLGVNAVLVDAALDTPAREAAARLALPILEVQQLDSDIAGMAHVPQPAPHRTGCEEPVCLDDTALVLTTSGTTSHSKTVPVRHRELWHKCSDSARSLGLTSQDRCLNFMPLFYAHGLLTVGHCILAGGSTIFLPDFDIDRFAEQIRTLAPTWYSGSFTFHHQILANAERLKEVVASSPLQFARSSAGALDAEIARKIEEELGIPVIQTYATTEAGMIACNPRPPRQRRHGSAGLPTHDGVAIMNESGEILPPGCEGEVVVGGECVFQGYENDAAATAAAFNGKWFRTGDLGLIDDDGFIHLTGRLKEVINRGGEMITPLEVEGVLLKHPDVAAATVFPVPHETLGEEVAAAVILEKRAVMTEEILARFAAKSLTRFKVPRRFLFVDAIPKSAAEKINRRDLAAAFGLAGTVRKKAPGKQTRRATQLEATLQRLWAEALGVTTVGLEDDFFLLGGDSLQAVELFLRIEKELGRQLPRSVLFEAGTVAEMAKRIESSVPLRCPVPIQPKGTRPIFFCIHGISGQVLSFRDLAQHLGADQPFYGVQSVGLDGAETPLAKIEDMATRYIAEIRQLQPTGPYYLGGYSMGGRVVHEMARQLRAAGETVGLLALLDSDSSQGRPHVPLSQWLRRHRDRVSRLRRSEVAPYLALRVRNMVEMTSTAVRRRLFAAAWRLGENYLEEMPRFLRRPMDANVLAIDSHQARAYDGDAVLFRTMPYGWRQRDAHNGWRGLIHGELEVRSITGRHHEIVEEPHVQNLARELADCLDRRQQGETPQNEVLAAAPTVG